MSTILKKMRVLSLEVPAGLPSPELDTAVDMLLHQPGCKVAGCSRWRADFGSSVETFAMEGSTG